MTATLPAAPNSSPHVGLLKLARGTLVRVVNQAGVFRVSAPAGWGGKDYATPTHYNLVGPTGRVVAAVPSGSISIMSDVLQEELAEAPTNPIANIVSRRLRRLLNDPEATWRMAQRLLGNRADPNRPLREIAEMLTPRYFETHCWACAKHLDNLYDEACPKCEGLKCKCGGCRCNWPYRTWGILPANPVRPVRPSDLPRSIYQ